MTIAVFSKGSRSGQLRLPVRQLDCSKGGVCVLGANKLPGCAILMQDVFEFVCNFITTKQLVFYRLPVHPAQRAAVLAASGRGCGFCDAEHLENRSPAQPVVVSAILAGKKTYRSHSNALHSGDTAVQDPDWREITCCSKAPGKTLDVPYMCCAIQSDVLKAVSNEIAQSSTSLSSQSVYV